MAEIHELFESAKVPKDGGEFIPTVQQRIATVDGACETAQRALHLQFNGDLFPQPDVMPLETQPANVFDLNAYRTQGAELASRQVNEAYNDAA